MRCAGALYFFGDGGGKTEKKGMVVDQRKKRYKSHQRNQGMVGEEFDFSDTSDSSDCFGLVKDL